MCFVYANMNDQMFSIDHYCLFAFYHVSLSLSIIASPFATATDFGLGGCVLLKTYNVFVKAVRLYRYIKSCLSFKFNLVFNIMAHLKRLYFTLKLLILVDKDCATELEL